MNTKPILLGRKHHLAVLGTRPPSWNSERYERILWPDKNQAVELPVGTTVVQFSVLATVRDGRNQAVFAAWDEVFAIKLLVVEPGGDRIKMTQDPAVASQIEQNIELRNNEIRTALWGSVIDIHDLSVPLVGRLFLEKDGHRWLFGELVLGLNLTSVVIDCPRKYRIHSKWTTWLT